MGHSDLWTPCKNKLGEQINMYSYLRWGQNNAPHVTNSYGKQELVFSHNALSTC